MKREVRVEDLARLYTANDMVKVDCGGCDGCSQCCRTVGDTIQLDPYDIWQWQKGFRMSPEEMFQKGYFAFNLADGLILPNLKMTEEGVCPFLNEEGRCSIHGFRPGFCRLFPLGRYYEGEDFRYYLQMDQCPKPVKTKVKVEKWLGIPHLRRYEAYILEWHGYLVSCREQADGSEEENARKNIAMYLLQQFYLKPYDITQDFYPQFEERMSEAQSLLTF
jgi:hypothetical protein